MSQHTRNPVTRPLWLLMALALPAVVLGPADLPASAAPADPGPTALSADCEVTLEPAAVTPAEDPVALSAELSEPIGPVEDVAIDPESGALVQDFEILAPNRIDITLETVDAAPGEWTVTLSGETGTCTGVLTVES